MPAKHLQTIGKKYRVDTSMICFIKFILESYEGIAQLTTLNSKMGLIEIYAAQGCLEEVEKIINDLKKQMLIEVWNISEKNADTEER
ncbi:MAG: DUF4911 domain-containing protein [Desulfobacterales bacterium]